MLLRGTKGTQSIILPISRKRPPTGSSMKGSLLICMEPLNSKKPSTRGSRVVSMQWVEETLEPLETGTSLPATPPRLRSTCFSGQGCVERNMRTSESTLEPTKRKTSSRHTGTTQVRKPVWTWEMSTRSRGFILRSHFNQIQTNPSVAMAINQHAIPSLVSDRTRIFATKPIRDHTTIPIINFHTWVL